MKTSFGTILAAAVSGAALFSANAAKVEVDFSRDIGPVKPVNGVGQPATVLLSSIELLRMPDTDEETRKAVLDMCYDAVIEIRSLLAQMKKRREYVAEAYLDGNESAGKIISFGEWGDKPPPDAKEDR